MATLEITDAQIEEKKRVLVTMFRNRYPDGDWTRQSVLYDHVFGAVALNALVNDAQVAELQQLFSLDAILAIADADTRQQALARFASNLLLEVHAGTPARGFVDVVFGSQREGIVPPGTRFYGKSNTMVLDNPQGVVYSVLDLSPVVNSTNQTVGYRLSLPVVTTGVGVTANAAEQRLVAYDKFDSDISYVEIRSKLTGGTDRETAEDFAERLPDAVTLRQPTTARALRTILRNAFPEIESQPFVAGFGTPEMVRDQVPVLDLGMRIHRGGAVDIYVDTAPTRTPISAVVGGEQQDASPALIRFRDLDMDFRDIDLRGLTQPGDVLRIHNPETYETALYRIASVHAYHLVIDELTPFSAVRPVKVQDARMYTDLTIDPSVSAVTVPDSESRFTVQSLGDYVYITDGATSVFAAVLAVLDLNSNAYGTRVLLDDPGNSLAALDPDRASMQVYRGRVIYSIGDNYPGYDNKVAVRHFGNISRTIRVPGCIQIETVGANRVYDVELDDAGSLPESAGTGVIRFPYRLNSPPPAVTTPAGQNRGYQVANMSPLYAGSAKASTYLRVGPEDARGGTRGALVVAAGYITFTSSLAAFSVDDIGARIIIYRAENRQNAGAYVITAVLGALTVELVRLRRLDGMVDSVSEAALPWRLDSSSRYDGRTIRAKVDAHTSVSAMQAYLDRDDVRPIACDLLVRAQHTVYVGIGTASMAFPGMGVTSPLQYVVKSSQTRVFPEAAARAYLAENLERFDRSTQELNAFDAAVWITTAYPEYVDRVLPAELSYALVAPSGRLIYFRSADKLALEPAYLVDASQTDELAEARGQGVSDRTIRLRSSADLIRLQRV